MHNSMIRQTSTVSIVSPNSDYTDVDVLFLQPPSKFYRVIDTFNATQVMGMVVEHENDSGLTWYARFARHPYYPPQGLNAGLLFVNAESRDEIWVFLASLILYCGQLSFIRSR